MWTINEWLFFLCFQVMPIGFRYLSLQLKLKPHQPKTAGVTVCRRTEVKEQRLIALLFGVICLTTNQTAQAVLIRDSK